MDLEAQLLRLVAPLGVGDELLPGVRLVRASASSGWRLTFDDGGREIHVELALRDPARPAAATTAELAVSYRLARSGATLDPARGKQLADAVARHVEPREQDVLESIARQAARARRSDADGARVREVTTARALEPMGTPDERFYGLSPYAGCVVGCRFCYADSRLRPLRRLERLEELPWGSYVEVRANVAEVLAAELPVVRPRVVKFCPILSDPYQGVERRYGLTRACLEVLAGDPGRPTVLVLTRTALVTRDVDVLAAIPNALAGVSLPTVDEAVRLHFEPRAASVETRLETLRTLRASGVRTFAIVQPLLPGPVEGLADALASTVTSVRIDVLYGVEGAVAEFSDPRYAHARDPAWQRDTAAALAAALRTRGVGVWGSELPPEG